MEHSPMITVPVAVNNGFFEWQVSLWWWNHWVTYGDEAAAKAFLILIDKNYGYEEFRSPAWVPSGLPYALCTGVWAVPTKYQVSQQELPLNIQVGLRQIIDRFPENEILEVIDCDLFHFRHHPRFAPPDGSLVVCDLYEGWHLRSLTTNRRIIEPYFENGGAYYNGGFVPIIGKASTFKAIITEWEAVHRDIIARPYGQSIHWWAGMFALQAACEKAKVTMIGKDWCFIPGVNQLNRSHYIGHYSCDREYFPKYKFPHIDVGRFPSNVYYARLKAWLESAVFVNDARRFLEPGFTR
jgi:hypothetical protein